MALAGAHHGQYNFVQPAQRMFAMKDLRRYVQTALVSGAFAFALSAVTAVTAGAQKSDGKDNPDAAKPKVKLSAQPMVAISPARVVLTAELIGGANDFEDFYCPTVEWEWGDGTTSENSTDCAPYEQGKSEIKRRFTVQHVFERAMNYRVQFRLKRRSKPVGFASVTVQVRPGLREGEQ
jgi:hypothetical protein